MMDEGRSGDLLPPSSISYQQRLSDKDVRHELETLLEEKRWLLILGRTGLGKTREAAELAQRMNQRGWTVLDLTHTELVNEPATFPLDKIGATQKLLFVLDDLTKKMRRGKSERLSRPGDPAQQIQAPLQDRLLRTLNKYKELCGSEDEIRVIATARSETERENPNEPSEWEKLEWERYPAFWQSFARYDLPPPNLAAQTNLLEATAQAAVIQTDAQLQAMARRNDGTFRNLVENLRNAKRENRALTLDNFAPSLKGNWDKQYKEIIKKYPAARYVFDAVDLLRAVDVDLYTFTVEPTARLIADGNLIQRFQHRLAIRRALPYLVQRNVLTPADGQIEAKAAPIDVRKYVLSNSALSPLAKLVLRIADRHPTQMLASLNGLGGTLYNLKQTEQAAALWRKGTELDPKTEIFWNNLGVALADLKRYDAAEQAYRTAIDLNPQDATAYNNLGNLLAKDATRYDAAEQAYRTAIDLNPQDASAYYNLGSLLDDMKNYDAAEQAYRTAIDLNPQLEPPYFNLAILLYNQSTRRAEAESLLRAIVTSETELGEALGEIGYYLRMQERLVEAEPFYRRVLELDPQNTNRLSGFITLLRQTEREQEALAHAENYYAQAPDEADAPMALAALYRKLGRMEESKIYADKARTHVKPDEHYLRACLESICGNVDEALRELRLAAQDKDFDRDWARRDPDLEWIREDPRFDEIVKTRSADIESG